MRNGVKFLTFTYHALLLTHGPACIAVADC
jgi:hypothetical protein